MSIEKPILEVESQTLALEDCNDPTVSTVQIEALQELQVAVMKGRIRTSNSTVHYTHLKPAQSNGLPTIVVANGLAAPEEAYNPFTAELGALGHEVVSIKPPRTQNIWSSIQPKHLKDVLLLQSQATWAVMKLLDQDMYTLYGHSTGAATNTRVATEKSERVSTIITAGGAGMNGRNSFVMMALRTGGVVHDVYNGRRSLRAGGDPHLARSAAYHIFRRLDRTAREAYTVAIENSQQRLEQIKSSGIRIGAILFEDDVYYSPGTVLAQTGHLLDVVHLVPEATHTHPQEHPIEHAAETSHVAGALLADSALRTTA